ncbi:unnamed protein product [Ceutorhynchus assimilis]|uniref:C2H2-type domain-containing protein n=1 Tax=Ceutorhynchus assimilis TaxID=467358 RepID=A0A9N9QS33_9CUCU|nr:unnamed protein product [Ceutorhynchus assimilis]
MENGKEKHPGSTKIKIISNFILNSSHTNNNSQNVQDNTEFPPPEPLNPMRLPNSSEEPENSSDTLEYETDQLIEYDIASENVNPSNELMSNKCKPTDSQYEETVEFNYLTGTYERVKKFKESSTTLVKEIEVETTQQRYTYKCFDCNFSSNHHIDLKYHAKKHFNSVFVCPNHKSGKSATVVGCLKCIYAKCVDNFNRSRLKNHKKKTKPIKIMNKTTPTPDRRHRYRCFHCEYKIGSKEYLKYHALKLHHDQNFSCNEHSDKNKVGCQKCVYQQVLINLKEDLRICANCSFKTCKETTFKRHIKECSSKVAVDEKDTDDNNDENLNDSDEEYSPSMDRPLSSRVNHKIVPNKVDSQTPPVNDNTDVIIIDDTDVDEAVPTKNKTEANLKEESNVEYSNYRDNNTDITSSLESNNYDFICYDCPFKAYMEADHLTTHAKTHEESTFTCFEHAQFMIFCKRCIYQYTLMSLKLRKIICKYCPKKFESLYSALIHMRGNCTDQRNFTGYLMCYDCGFKPNSRLELFKHAAIHKSSYQCFEHEQPQLKTCSKCLYEFLVKSLYRCFKCDCSKIKSEYELRSHIEAKHLQNTFYPPIKCNKHSQSSECCRQCVMKQICDDAYLQKICPICSTRWTFLGLHISSAHRNAKFICHAHIDKKVYGKCGGCYTEKILETQEKTWNCCQCTFVCNSKEELELHIVVCHWLETFMCPQHSLGDIQSNCDMCAYETIALKLSQ